MNFFLAFHWFAVAFIITCSAYPFKRDVDPSLVPEFGLASGINPTGTGDCDGIKNAAGQVVKIPCSCPPDRNSFIQVSLKLQASEHCYLNPDFLRLQSLNANVNAGRAVNNPSVAVSFPTDNSIASQLARLQTAIVTLQNLKGPGVGCPAASTTFVAQQKAIQNGGAPARATPSPAPAPAQSNTSAHEGVNPALVPQFGLAAGLNPTGTGDCDGIRNAAGQVIKIPCSCPPNRDVFIKVSSTSQFHGTRAHSACFKDLSANVAAGKVINNPSVTVSFPTDNSKAAQLARLQAAIVTLQNLNGPGKGCPAASTTFLAQQKAIQDSA